MRLRTIALTVAIVLPIISFAASPSELVDDYETSATQLIPILPPAPSIPIGMNMGVVGTDGTDWPFKMTSVSTNGVTAYPFFVVRDPDSSAILLCDQQGIVVARSAPSQDYSPVEYAITRYPEHFESGVPDEYGEWLLAVYDPSRIYGIGLLMAEQDVATFRAAEQARKDAIQLASALSMPMAMGMQTDELHISGFQVTSTGVVVTANIPTALTNDLSIFTTSDLIGDWWDVVETVTRPSATNILTWAHAFESSGSRFITLGDAELDSDEDGVPDSEELLVYHTSPTNSASIPLSVSGEVTYWGSETGSVYVVATTVSNSWQIGNHVELTSPGAYTNERIAVGRAFWHGAFLDLDGDGMRSTWEPHGRYSETGLAVTSSVSGVDIEMDDMPSVWGEIDYDGTIQTMTSSWMGMRSLPVRPIRIVMMTV